MNQKERVLNALKTFPNGVSNTTLNTICFRYSARIKDLRQDGHKILTIRQTPTLFIFKLV